MLTVAPPPESLADGRHWREDDVFAGEGLGKVREAAARYALVEPADRAEFREGYALLERQFGPTGEIETADALMRWFERGSLSPPGALIRAHYHMVIAREKSGPNAGEIAAVRDCFVTTDRRPEAPPGGRAHVLLSHTLVLPDHRRTGVGALMRHVPIALARERLVSDPAVHGHRVFFGSGRLGDGGSSAPVADPHILLFAEMDQVTADDRNTVIRLLAYGRAGFRVIPPTVLPFAQPDFRDEVQRGDVDPQPLPFLCVVREVGRDGAHLTADRVRDVVEHVLAVHACHARADHLEQIRQHALRAVDAHGGAPIPLIELPRTAADIAMLEPLLRPLTFPLYPPSWRGDAPLSRPEDELAALITAWRP